MSGWGLVFVQIPQTSNWMKYLDDTWIILQFSSVQFSCSVVSDSLRPHESQHARRPCPSPSPGVHSDSCPSTWWCHPAISSSVKPFSSCPQSLPASESSPMSQLFSWGGRIIGVSALASSFQGMSSFRMDWLDLLAVQGTLKSLFQHHSSKPSILWRSAFEIYIYMNWLIHFKLTMFQF